MLIPTSEGAVGGIVSEPARQARAALILLAGYGRPARSGTNSFWTRLARRLAERGLVVLRVDYSREGDTLPIGEGVSGQARKRELDMSLLGQVLPWFHERLEGLPLLLAGSCSGGRAAIELAGQHRPAAVAGTFLLNPHLRVLEGAERQRRGDTGHDEHADPDAVDPAVVDCFRVILAHAPSWILVGEHDENHIPELERMLGPIARELELEIVPDAALHFLDQPDIQLQAERRLVARIERALARPGS